MHWGHLNIVGITGQAVANTTDAAAARQTSLLSEATSGLQATKEDHGSKGNQASAGKINSNLLMPEIYIISQQFSQTIQCILTHCLCF